MFVARLMKREQTNERKSMIIMKRHDYVITGVFASFDTYSETMMRVWRFAGHRDSSDRQFL